MEPKINKMKNSQAGHHEHLLRQEISDGQKTQNASAHHEAERDIETDADLSVPGTNDDLDEG